MKAREEGEGRGVYILGGGRLGAQQLFADRGALCRMRWVSNHRRLARHGTRSALFFRDRHGPGHKMSLGFHQRAKTLPACIFPHTYMYPVTPLHVSLLLPALLVPRLCPPALHQHLSRRRINQPEPAPPHTHISPHPRIPASPPTDMEPHTCLAPTSRLHTTSTPQRAH